MKINPISTRTVTFAFASCAAIATAWILLQMADIDLSPNVVQTQRNEQQTEGVSSEMENLNAGNKFALPPDEISQTQANVEDRQSELEASQRKSKKLNDLLYVNQAKLKKQGEVLKSRELELEASLKKNKQLNDLLYESRETLKQEQFKLGQLQKEVTQLQDQNELLSISLKILLLLVLIRVRAIAGF